MCTAWRICVSGIARTTRFAAETRGSSPTTDDRGATPLRITMQRTNAMDAMVAR